MSMLFVYGTLLRGQPAWTLIQDKIRSYQSATVVGRLFSIEDQYPGFVRQGTDLVCGALIELIDDNLFAVLDRYEGPEYRRIIVEVILPNEMTDAWTYELVADPRPTTRIPGGNWVEYIGRSDPRKNKRFR